MEHENVNVSLSLEEVNLLISSLAYFVDYLDDMLDIEQSVAFCCKDFLLAGAIVKAQEEVKNLLQDSKSLRAKLRLLKGGEK